ncbi:MAG TPA: T9SS type A sorting domain-containing protein [Chitinophagales bacterium]|nr:T9SS type A sorting domain-containing protein [Chitinophagales bacterium]
MIKKFYALIIMAAITFTASAQVLVYHVIQKDSGGALIPWYSPNPGLSYDHDLQLIWNFWKNFPSTNGVKNYMTDHSYCGNQCGNKVGGDQFAMLLSSWALLYAYTGDTAIVNNMRYIADTYLAHSLSPFYYAWPNLPFPCNYGDNTSDTYDGDYLLGLGITQPDKAGSFGAELLNLYKITRDTNYLNAAVNIANTLADKVQAGSSSNSPYPFKIEAQGGSSVLSGSFNYTGNVVPTLRLFEDLAALNMGHVVKYDTAYNMIKRWVQAYPQQNNNWGNFFEDIYFPSNTEINAVTMAYYIMQHPGWSSTYKQDARSILNWTLNTLGSHAYDSLGVTAIYEQTVDLKEGGSHTSRFASAELLYSLITGDTSRREQAIRQLNWATYLCDTSGQVRFSPQETTVWLTDGYGDYVRHFIRAMYNYPTIAPYNANHLLGSTSVISFITYQPQEIFYSTFDDSASETLRLTSKPLKVTADGVEISELQTLNTDGWTWTPYDSGGVLKVLHTHSHDVNILWTTTSINTLTENVKYLSVFPNPVNETLNLNYALKNAGPVTIQVLNLLGQKLQEVRTDGNDRLNTLQLNVSALEPGTYFARIVSAQGQAVRQFVVSR